MIEEKEKKLYPKEIVAVKNNGTFCVTAELSRSQKKDGESLTIFTPFSRFVFTIINEQKNFVTANFPVKEIAELMHKNDYANMEHLKDLYDAEKKEKDVSKSKAYTVKIASGYLKGKTPAEALLEDPEKNIENLKRQYVFLEKNLKKYPKNKEQMDAIVEASTLFKSGRLNANEVSKFKVINLYNAPIRPLSSKTKKEDEEKGIRFVYSLNINWNVGDEMPVEITIENYLAPYKEKDDGTINVFPAEKTQYKKISMSISSKEWNNVVERMYETKNSCSNMFFPKCFEDAFYVDKEQREKYNAKR